MQTIAIGRESYTGPSCGLFLLMAVVAGLGEDTKVEHTARVDTGTLQAVIADNQSYGAEHRAGYNGVAELRLGPGSPKNLFVPSYAGLNFEHIFSGDAESFGWNTSTRFTLAVRAKTCLS